MGSGTKSGSAKEWAAARIRENLQRRRLFCLPLFCPRKMAKLTQLYAGYEAIPRTKHNDKPTKPVVNFWLGISTLCLMALVLSIYTTQTADTEYLAASKKQMLKYGDTITLLNVYNNYLAVSPSGSTTTSGYLGANDRIRVVSPAGKSGEVQYGDTVSLVGRNNRYLSTRYSAKVTCRAEVITPAAQFLAYGGSGPIAIGDRIAFKSQYGYMTGAPSGVRA